MGIHSRARPTIASLLVFISFLYHFYINHLHFILNISKESKFKELTKSLKYEVK